MTAFRNGGRPGPALALVRSAVQPDIINSVLACELTNSPYPTREGRHGVIVQPGRSVGLINLVSCRFLRRNWIRDSTLIQSRTSEGG